MSELGDMHDRVDGVTQLYQNGANACEQAHIAASALIERLTTLQEMGLQMILLDPRREDDSLHHGEPGSPAKDFWILSEKAQQESPTAEPVKRLGDNDQIPALSRAVDSAERSSRFIHGSSFDPRIMVGLLGEAFESLEKSIEYIHALAGHVHNRSSELQMGGKHQRDIVDHLQQFKDSI